MESSVNIVGLQFRDTKETSSGGFLEVRHDCKSKLTLNIIQYLKCSEVF